MYYDARLALVCVTGAPLVVYPLDSPWTTGTPHDPAQSGGAGPPVPHHRRKHSAGHRIVKAFGGEAYERQRFDRAADDLYRTNMKVTSTLSVLPPLMEWLGALGIVAVLVLRQQRDRICRSSRPESSPRSWVRYS